MYLPSPSLNTLNIGALSTQLNCAGLYQLCQVFKVSKILDTEYLIRNSSCCQGKWNKIYSSTRGINKIKSWMMKFNFNCLLINYHFFSNHYFWVFFWFAYSFQHFLILFPLLTFHILDQFYMHLITEFQMGIVQQFKSP